MKLLSQPFHFRDTVLLCELCFQRQAKVAMGSLTFPTPLETGIILLDMLDGCRNPGTDWGALFSKPAIFVLS